MLETSKICIAACLVLGVTACATPEVQETPPPAPVAATPIPAAPVVDETARAQEARAFLAQAESDIQKARSKRALWSKAWESLVLARQSAASKDNAATVRHAKRASELAELGLEQLAYPAVK